MEFSWNYEDTMKRLVSTSNCGTLDTNCDVRDVHGYSCILKFSFIEGSGEIPTFSFSEIRRYLLQSHEEINTFVLPLYMSNCPRGAAGAETIIKQFTRIHNGRLVRVTTPKGETYYGNYGIILDEDLNPLLLSTVDVSFNHKTNRLEKNKFIIHFTPKVFTDDSKVLNKSLAKKGIAYYLSHACVNWERLPHKVVIDDCSDYFIKVQKPNVNNCTDRELNKVLKDNIGEILGQISNDSKDVIW